MSCCRADEISPALVLWVAPPRLAPWKPRERQSAAPTPPRSIDQRGGSWGSVPLGRGNTIESRDHVGAAANTISLGALSEWDFAGDCW